MRVLLGFFLNPRLLDPSSYLNKLALEVLLSVEAYVHQLVTFSTIISTSAENSESTTGTHRGRYSCSHQLETSDPGMQRQAPFSVILCLTIRIVSVYTRRLISESCKNFCLFKDRVLLFTLLLRTSVHTLE
ncbi:hypothetical protein CBL_07492 [Carabus blaptoides fortunei]